MEVHCLVDEVRKYCTLIKLMQKSLQDTRKTFHDINEAKCVIESELTYFNVFLTEIMYFMYFSLLIGILISCCFFPFFCRQGHVAS